MLDIHFSCGVEEGDGVVVDSVMACYRRESCQELPSMVMV